MSYAGGEGQGRRGATGDPGAVKSLPPPAVLTSAPASTGKRASLSPYARAPYTWIMQSVIVQTQTVTKYTAAYYEAPTDRTVETPLTLPAGASIVDVSVSHGFTCFRCRIKRAMPSPTRRRRN